MAERIGYMFDRAQGARGGERSPWLFAADAACPAFGTTPAALAQPLQTLTFVRKALKPKN
jgi:hypothetical protein